MGTAKSIRHPERRQLTVVLVKPSKYDDEGYVIRHFRGVLPSNTLACLYGLTEALKKNKYFGNDCSVNVKIFDDTVQKIPVKRIIRSQSLPEKRTVVALVGVQSNQFPRASDLARRFRKGGLQVLIGGFHVSGALSLSQGITPEIQELLDLGVSAVKGEVEETWGGILADALEDRLQPLYDFLDKKPDLCRQPVPMIHRRYLRRYVTSNFGTIDCSRGCPYNCSFCSIINVQGKSMRTRSLDVLAHAMRENHRRHGINYYFFTDDNFSRNPNWRQIFEMLIKMREEENIRIEFMMQVDTQSYKIADFVMLAARAGCCQVFIGMESINPQNLKAAGKVQNKVREFRDMISAWHSERIVTHAAYIIGFPFDTPESVHADVECLKNELGVEQASFFMLTPLPGSQDHARMLREGVYMDPDLNNFDSFHETTRHPNFAPGEWHAVYKRAWREFYSYDYMRETLARANHANYWNIFRNFIWYKNSALIEGGHPMLHGFFRLRDRCDRRPGFMVESRLKHFVRRCRELRHLASEWISLALEMEEVWLQTRKRSEAELRLVAELKRIRKDAGRSLRTAELRLAYHRAKTHVPDLGVPSRVTFALRDFNLALANRVTYSRGDLKRFWDRTWANFRRRRLFRIRPHRILINFVRDVQLFVLFVRALVRSEPLPSPEE
jgi:radical SAM superfamily enzyme YgiQ (UPF0313 family)